MLSDEWADQRIVQWTVLVPVGVVAVVMGDGIDDVVVVAGDSVTGERALACFPCVEVSAVSAEDAVGPVLDVLLNDHDWCWVGYRHRCRVEYVGKPSAVTTTC